MRKIPAELCVKCKGYKYLCGLPSCPILDRFRSIVHVASKIQGSEKIEGSTPPSIVIGEKNYPKVSLIYNIPPGIKGEEAREYENPEGWWGKKSLSDILSLRSSLVSTILHDVNINEPEKLYEKEIALAGISEKPVLSEAQSEVKQILPRLKFDGILIPRGPSIKAKDIKVDENPKIPNKIESLIFDDVKAEEGVLELYSSGENYYRIITTFSLGLLGRKKNRRIVPTRWSITAVDQIVGNYLLSKIKEFDTISTTTVYYNSYLGNYFHIIFYPSRYSSIWIEIWYPFSLWSNELVITDLSEDYWGEYEFLDGGYMAARLAVIEKLNEMRRQAGIIIIREITSEYYAPVGNWHIREAVKKAYKIAEFDDLQKAINFVNSRLKSDRVKLNEIRSIKTLLTQTKIDFFLKK
ncbi:MAG: Nre family DNA repair protein [Stygiolobus sp.]|nr:Nre family DNA repair protein [Stygiolobus sp.]